MKIGFILILALLLVPLVMAKPITISSEQAGSLSLSANIPEAISQNVSREFKVHVFNISQVIINATCKLHIFDEDYGGGHLWINQTNKSVDDDFGFVVPASVHSDKGTYSFKAYCNTSGQAGFFEHGYYVTKSGKLPAEGLFLALIYFLFIFATMGLFATFLMTLAKIATADSTVFDVLLSWGFVILNLIVVHLAEEYLLSSFVENLTNFFITLTTWTNGVLPLIAFIISMIFRSLKKKKPLGMQEINGWRGY